VVAQDFKMATGSIPQFSGKIKHYMQRLESYFLIYTRQMLTWKSLYWLWDFQKVNARLWQTWYHQRCHRMLAMAI